MSLLFENWISNFARELVPNILPNLTVNWNIIISFHASSELAFIARLVAYGYRW